jgi:hypothetical protein
VKREKWKEKQSEKDVMYRKKKDREVRWGKWRKRLSEENSKRKLCGGTKWY